MSSFRELHLRPSITDTSDASFSGLAQSDIYITLDRSSSIVVDGPQGWTDMVIAVKQLIINLQQFIESGDIKIGLTSWVSPATSTPYPEHIVHFDLSNDYNFIINFMDELSTQTELANGNTGISPGWGLAYACSALHPTSTSPSTGKGRDNVDKIIILVTDGVFQLGTAENAPQYPFNVALDARLGTDTNSTSDLWTFPVYGGFDFPGGSPNNSPFIQCRIIGILVNGLILPDDDDFGISVTPIATVSGPAGSFSVGGTDNFGVPFGQNEDWFIGASWGDFYEIANQITNGLVPDVIPNLQEASYTSQSLAGTSFLNPATIDFSGKSINDIQYQYHVYVADDGTIAATSINYLSLDLNLNSFPENQVRGGSSYTHVKVKGVITQAFQDSTSNPAASNNINKNSVHFEHLLFLDPISSDGTIPTTAKWKFKVINTGTLGAINIIDPILSAGEYISGEANDQPHSINYNSSTGKWDFSLKLRDFDFPAFFGEATVKCTYLLL